VFGVESGVYNVHTFHSNFFFFLLLEWGGVVQANSSQVLDMFPKEFPIALHFIPYALANVVLLSPTTHL